MAEVLRHRTLSKYTPLWLPSRKFSFPWRITEW